jgi:hypothetical protein
MSSTATELADPETRLLDGRTRLVDPSTTLRPMLYDTAVLAAPPPRKGRAAAMILFLAALFASVAVTVALLTPPARAPIESLEVLEDRSRVRVEPRPLAEEKSARVPAGEQKKAPVERVVRAPIERGEKPAVGKVETVHAEVKAPDLRARLDALRAQVAALRRTLPEDAPSRQRAIDLELDLAGARSIEDAERLKRVLDRVEQELGALAP